MRLKEKYTLDDLIEIIKRLRGENGCPWDKVQTHQSIKKDMLEEAYEAVDALDNCDDTMFANELGDVLLQVVFHSVMAEERNAFDFDSVLKEVCDKLITRHTHVYGDVKAENAEDALKTWEMNKKKEKGQTSYTELLEDLPKGMPALFRAEKIQKRAARAGFDWDNTDDVFAKVREELGELEDAMAGEGHERVEEEFGDLLFALVNLGRFLNVNSETALVLANSKFIKRFAKMEALAMAEGRSLDDMNLEEMDELWNKIKKIK